MTTTNSDTEVLSRSEQFRLTARLRGRKRAFCPRCDRPVQLVTTKKAENLFKTDALELANLANGGILHRLHNIHGELMICSDSLFTSFSDRSTEILTTEPAQFISQSAITGGMK